MQLQSTKRQENTSQKGQWKNSSIGRRYESTNSSTDIFKHPHLNAEVISLNSWERLKFTGTQSGANWTTQWWIYWLISTQMSWRNILAELK